MKRILSVTALLLIALATPAGAASYVLADCGPSTGTSYYLPGGAVPADEAGWQPDGINDGWLKLMLYGESELDVLYQSSGRKSGSLRGEGFTVLALNRAEPAGALLVIAVHPGGALEHYLFELDADSHPLRVVWGAVRGAPNPVEKSSLFVAECRAGG